MMATATITTISCSCYSFLCYYVLLLHQQICLPADPEGPGSTWSYLAVEKGCGLEHLGFRVYGFRVHRLKCFGFHAEASQRETSLAEVRVYSVESSA